MSQPFIIPGDMDGGGRIVFDEDLIPARQRRAVLKARFAGKRIECEVRLRKSKRSLLQNSWLHAAFEGWADFLGYGVDELKREMLALVFGTDEVTSPLTGEIRSALRKPHTSALTTKEFAEFMDRAMVTAAETGYIIEEPEEWKRRRAARVA